MASTYSRRDRTKDRLSGTGVPMMQPTDLRHTDRLRYLRRPSVPSYAGKVNYGPRTGAFGWTGKRVVMNRARPFYPHPSPSPLPGEGTKAVPWPLYRVHRGKEQMRGYLREDPGNLKLSYGFPSGAALKDTGDARESRMRLGARSTSGAVLVIVALTLPDCAETLPAASTAATV